MNEPYHHSKKNFLKRLLIVFTLGIALLFFSYATTPYANNLKKHFKDSRIELGGWIHGGATLNPSQGGGYNGPVVFADQANRFQLNQFNLFLQRPVISETRRWDFGGRFDFLFGTDAIFTQAFGVPAFDVNSGEPLNRNNWDLNLCCSSTRTYGIALPQAYLEVHVPIGKNGINLKAGHFYSPTGFETIPAPDNFFYTRTYSFNAGEPFTHTGLQANYIVNNNWSISGSAVTGSATGGWDGGWDRQLGNWGGVAGITWTSDNQATSLNVTGTYGETSTRSNEAWGMYNIVFQHKINPKTLLVLHHVHGYANGVLLNNLKYANVEKDAEWIGFVTHLYYDLTENLSVGARGEWFRDRDGFRNPSPFRVAAATKIVDGVATSYAGNLSSVTITPADYYAATIGLNWKAAKTLRLQWNAIKKLNIRSNIRYDRVDAYHTAAYRPFAGNKDQILFSLDFVIPF
ncbi:porin [Nitrosomonas ureae]|uniref:Putative beta-barrel porin-2, OmpL-like. bbp2 n=1 Tax=Nitrosomonas ureae TaxID=44577 RepID=A0A1H5XVM7_9PROT|nr:porin [Nitrosomonas ureae]SEG15585.1 Putative beta-barrel porin-2, OmpL-like. bbp2 [Nitrosomonas ureae]